MNTTDAPLVIVIPTKNRRSLLERALKSVRAQSYPNYRVVVVNDGSTDGTRSYLDSLNDPHIQVIHHDTNRGVNAARNDAFKTSKKGEWAIPLDDDDMLLPEALKLIADKIKNIPSSVEIVCFNAIAGTPQGEHDTGRRFETGEEWHDLSYEECFLDTKFRGDWRSAYKSTLFPKYLFQEDVNGFEGEWILLVTRDGVGVRMFPERIIWIDQVHEGEHVSNVAARRDPASFVRAHKRIFKAHQKFFDRHPKIAAARAIHAAKIAVRAYDPFSLICFGSLYARYLYLTLRQRIKDKDKP